MTGALTQVVGSMPLLCFAATKVMPGFTFPPAGRLGLTSPPSSVLRSAKTASAHHARFALRSLAVPPPVPKLSCPSPNQVRLAQVRWHGHLPDARALVPPGCPLLPVYSLEETAGSPEFPDHPRMRMPRSQIPAGTEGPPVRCPVCCLPLREKRRLPVWWLAFDRTELACRRRTAVRLIR